MELDHTRTHGRQSTARAVRHHLVVVGILLVLGAVAGWAYAGSSPASYTSTTRVLINPSVGNPFAPAPASVRQDQETSLETEAQIARSAEVLDVVAAQASALTTERLERGVQVSVPANTQILEISFTATDRVVAQQVADAVAGAYLANRARRFDLVTSSRIDSIKTQTLRVVDDLRAATAASQQGSAADRAFNSQLADALRNELVGLRAQRTALENSETPVGAVIAPATIGAPAGVLPAPVLPVGGALVGLGLGCLVAVLLERLGGRVRSADELDVAGLPVLAVAPQPHLARQLLGRGSADDFDATVRRLRAHVLELDPRPDIVAVAPAGDGRSDGLVSEALAESFAKAGHRVVLVRTDSHPSAGSLDVEVDGLAEALLHERLSVLELLQPSVEPLLSLLPAGRISPVTRELLTSERLRTALDPLVGVGHLLVVQSPGTGTVEGEAIVGAADLGLVVVDLGRTKGRDLASVVGRWAQRGTSVGGVVLGRRSRRQAGRTTARFGGRRKAIGLDRHTLAEDPATSEQSVGTR